MQCLNVDHIYDVHYASGVKRQLHVTVYAAPDGVTDTPELFVI